MRQDKEDSVPVLNAVVESGNESIIQSSRLGREVLRELEVLQESEPVKFVLQEHILDADDEEEGDESIASESQLALMMGDSSANSSLDRASSVNNDDEIELMIDDVVDRHITELRKDIRRLLNRVKQHT